MMRALNARRDPAWSADGFVSDRWLPVSPISGRLDAFEWKDPLTGDHAGAVIEAHASAMIEARQKDVSPAVSTRSDDRNEAVQDVGRSAIFNSQGGSPRTEEHSELVAASSEHASPPRPPRSAARSLATIPVPPNIIPLVHAPDDPGPEAENQSEADAESTGAPAPNWSRIRQLFRPQP
jgi:HemY protein